MTDGPSNPIYDPNHSTLGMGAAVASGASGAASASSKLAGRTREKFNPDELAIVLSHYDLGVIDAIQEYPRGSRRAPKAIIRAQAGLHLLKRRAKGKDNPFKVAFAHALQLHLASKSFPLPRLIGARRDNNSMVQWNSCIYELFEFIKGAGYDNSLAATTEGGRALAMFHKLVRGYQAEYEPPTGSYHASRSVAGAMDRIPQIVGQVEPESDRDGRLNELIGFMKTHYSAAAARVNDLGLPDWPMQIIHSDWHPGNMLFRGAKVVAVIDYDAARVQQRIIDIANGALQFSILGGGDDPSQWPDYLDESRYKRFIRGYESAPDSVLSKAELRTIAWLMIEALIAEAIIPIAATGSFARMEGAGFLQMVRRKVVWLNANADRLADIVAG